MESTVTETIAHESTPTGSVETRETTVQRDEGDITESWLSAQFASVTEALAQRLSVLESQQVSMLELLNQLQNRLPSNLTELLSQQQSTITSLTNQIAEMATRLLTPTPVVVPIPEPVVEPAPTLADPEASVRPEPVRPKRRAV